jgi:hypothetical protein
MVGFQNKAAQASPLRNTYRAFLLSRETLVKGCIKLAGVIRRTGVVCCFAPPTGGDQDDLPPLLAARQGDTCTAEGGIWPTLLGHVILAAVGGTSKMFCLVCVILVSESLRSSFGVVTLAIVLYLSKKVVLGSF